MIISTQLIEETEARYRERQHPRTEHRKKISSRNWLNADDPKRVQKRFERLGKTKGVSDVAFLERMFGDNDLVGTSFLELGLRVARTVGRMLYRSSTGATFAYGTGFLVSPRLLLTNNHVLRGPIGASDSLIEFNYQEGPDGRLLTPVVFNLEPEIFFMTDRPLDYSLVAVSQSSHDGHALQSFGWNRLVEEDGKIIVGEPLNIIQHPDGQPKQLALRENRLVDVLEDFLHYEGDTAEGSSGAPVFNNQWEVVGLHHSGAAKRDEQGRILTKEGTLWSKDMGEHKVAWIGNEGVRISRIVEHIKGQTLTTDMQGRLQKEMFEAEAVIPCN